MVVTQVYRKIEDNIKENFFKMFWFVFFNINKIIFCRFYILIVLLSIPIYCLEVFNGVIIKMIISLIIVFLFSISATLEETFHAGIIIIQGRKSEVHSLNFQVLKIGKRDIVGLGISIYCKGNFTQNDIFFLTICGPLLSLIVGTVFCLFSVPVFLVLHLSAYLFFVLCVGFLLLPLSSLIPFKFSLAPFSTDSIVTDGYKIIGLIQKHKISRMMLFLVVKKSIQMSCSYIFQSLRV